MIIADSHKNKYIGKLVCIFPNDTTPKYRIIKDIDELGWTFINCNKDGEIVHPIVTSFYPHSHSLLNFKILN